MIGQMIGESDQIKKCIVTIVYTSIYIITSNLIGLYHFHGHGQPIISCLMIDDIININLPIDCIEFLIIGRPIISFRLFRLNSLSLFRLNNGHYDDQFHDVTMVTMSIHMLLIHVLVPRIISCPSKSGQVHTTYYTLTCSIDGVSSITKVCVMYATVNCSI